MSAIIAAHISLNQPDGGRALGLTGCCTGSNLLALHCGQTVGAGGSLCFFISGGMLVRTGVIGVGEGIVAVGGSVGPLGGGERTGDCICVGIGCWETEWGATEGAGSWVGGIQTCT